VSAADRIVVIDEIQRIPGLINHPRPKGRGIHLMDLIDSIAASGGEFNP
jgi:hypothetical protein